MFCSNVLYRKLSSLLVCWVFLALPGTLSAEPLRIAVAANFKNTLEQLVDEFGKVSTADIRISVGATGALYAQLSNGAPFDIFFAADQISTGQLLNSGKALAGSVKTYALGQLVIAFNRDRLAIGVNGCQPGNEQNSAYELLKNVNSIAIANPNIAPYGKAAVQVLISLDLQASAGDGKDYRLLSGKNVLQAQQFLVTGHVDAAFISLNQAQEMSRSMQNFSFCHIERGLYQPIYQTMAIIDNKQRAIATTGVVKNFLTFMDSMAARKIILQQGYLLPDHLPVSNGGPAL